MNNSQKSRRSQAGFTLVELAIVMIIIGLLIAGVLKGQELIGNARVTATVAQIKAVDAATSTFKDTYQGLPGDLSNSVNRLPNCTAANNCAVAGNGDGVLGTVAAPFAFGAAPALANEQAVFFPQLSSADLITGIVPTLPAPLAFGGVFPQAKIDGVGLIPGSVPVPTAALMPANLAAVIASVPSGLYLSLTASATAASGGANALGMTPTQAYRIDTKLDDGNPTTGSVIGVGAATCGTAAAGYITSSTTNICGLYVRIQG